jgi:hydrogenase maturation protease
MKFGLRRTAVLALGNDILGDDGVGLLAARALRREIDEEVDIIESAEAGFAMLELLTGYDRALILDAVVTGKHAPGTILSFGAEDFRTVVAPSPHYAGIPEVLALAERLGVPFPKQLSILAMEVQDPCSIRESLTVPVRVALPDLVERACGVLESWGCGKTVADFY